MMITPISKPEDAKIAVYCEDAEARWFLRKLLGQKTMRRIKLGSGAGCGELSILVNRKFPEFRDSLLILDGDQRVPTQSNVILLPGGPAGGLNPENVIYCFLNSLDAEDDFWDNSFQYTKQVFLQNFERIANGQTGDRIKMKDWFNHEMRFWGKGGARLYNCWLKSNLEQSRLFRERFLKAFNIIAKRKNVPILEK